MDSDAVFASGGWNNIKWRYPNIMRIEKENKRLRAELAAALKERDEAHGLIRKWCTLIEIVDDGEIMYAMTSDGRCSMDDADKRAFLEATCKEGGGA